eukprot:jgi/Phyca11/509842/fgenesh2_kg.PHYCAscaffold_50_\
MERNALAVNSALTYKKSLGSRPNWRFLAEIGREIFRNWSFFSFGWKLLSCKTE